MKYFLSHKNRKRIKFPFDWRQEVPDSVWVSLLFTGLCFLFVFGLYQADLQDEYHKALWEGETSARIMWENRFKREKEPIKATIRRLCPDHADTLITIAFRESSFNPKAVGRVDNDDLGLYQINQRFHPEVGRECSFSVPCSTRWACQKVREGQVGLWNTMR